MVAIQLTMLASTMQATPIGAQSSAWCWICFTSGSACAFPSGSDSVSAYIVIIGDRALYKQNRPAARPINEMAWSSQPGFFRAMRDCTSLASPVRKHRMCDAYC